MFEELRDVAVQFDPEGGWREGPQTLQEAQKLIYKEFFRIGEPWNPEAIRDAQAADPAFKLLIHYLRFDDFPPRTTVEQMNKVMALEGNFMVYNKILYKYVRKSNPNRKFSMYQMVVPEMYRELLLEQYHSSKYGGHLGFDKVYPKLQEKFFWPRQAEELKEFIDKCIPCLRQKMGPIRRGELHPRRASSPFHMLGIDVMGPMSDTPTPRGNQYVVSFVDYYTKYPISFATPDCTAQTIVRLLHQEIIPNHGAPKVVICDRGPCFTAKQFKATAEELGFQVSYTSPYHHRSNGLVERWQRTLTGMLKPAAELDTRNWDDFLNPCVFAYRTAVHASTGQTPFFLYHGREANQPGPGEALMPTMFGVTSPAQGQVLVERMKQAWKQAEEENERSQQYQKQHHDKRVRRQKLEVGDLVLRREHQRDGRMNRAGGRFHPEFHALFRIWEVIEETNRVVVGLVDNPGLPRQEVSQEDFKLFRPSEEDYAGYMTRRREALAGARDAEAMRGVKCGTCDQAFTAEYWSEQENPWAECSHCLQWYHFRCAGLDAEPPDVWYCPSCDAISGDGSE
jgi:hypothetical protein